MGLTDDVPLKYAVTIRGIYTTVEKGKVTLIDGHSPHPWRGSHHGGDGAAARRGAQEGYKHKNYNHEEDIADNEDGSTEYGTRKRRSKS